MASEGFEVSLSTLNVYTPNFSWTTSANVGYTYAEITRLDFDPILADALKPEGAAVLGGPRRSIFSARFAGLNEIGIPPSLMPPGSGHLPTTFRSATNCVKS